MKILISEFEKKRPWLDLDNGELYYILKNTLYDTKFKWIYQIKDIVDIKKYTKEYDLIIIHIEHQSLYKLRDAYSWLKENENNIIVYGYGVAFERKLTGLKYAISTDDIHDVIEVINLKLGTKIIYGKNYLSKADFSALPIAKISNFPIRYSKGCENNCPYCERSLEKIKVYKTANDLKEEIETAKNNYGISAITFMDSSLLGGDENKFFSEIVPILKAAKLPWRANGITLASLNLEKIKILADSGCYLISLGIESFAPNVKTGKKIDIKYLESILLELRKYNIISLAFFITGLENDTYEKSLYTLQTAFKMNFDIRLLASAVALPGTKLWEFVSEKGKFLCEIDNTFPDKKTTIHFETPEFSENERRLVLEKFSMLKNSSNLIKNKLKNELGIMWSTSEQGNIIWK